MHEETTSDGSLEGGVLNQEKLTAVPLPTLAQLSAVLFVATRPATVQQLAEAVGVDSGEVEQVLEVLCQKFDPNEVGFGLSEVNGGWQFRTAEGAGKAISRFVPPRAKRLSKAAAETLAIVAYKQPLGKAEIESTRGVDALPTLRTLLDLKLIRVVGREESPGNPLLYGTTEFFLEKFGLRDLSQLPSMREVEELLAEGQELSDDLNEV